MCMLFSFGPKVWGGVRYFNFFLMNFKNSLISKKGEVAKFKIAYYIFNNIQL